eukprot:jgi/Ulvmu1/11399/UM075_0061.1
MRVRRATRPAHRLHTQPMWHACCAAQHAQHVPALRVAAAQLFADFAPAMAGQGQLRLARLNCAPLQLYACLAQLYLNCCGSYRVWQGGAARGRGLPLGKSYVGKVWEKACRDACSPLWLKPLS